MRKLKEKLFGVSLVLAVLLGIGLFPKKVTANMKQDKEWVLEGCYDNAGKFLGFTNDCKPGSSNCLPNDCSRFNQ